MGRNKIELKKTDYAKIRRLGARGVSEVDITKALGISFPTWKRLKSEDEQALEALEEARREEESELVGVLYEAATKDKNLTAAMFLLKARHGYKEGAEQVNANQVNVKITLPGAMNENEYQKLVQVNNEN
ncbi:MAG: hypothetical protein JJU13_12355 [Balneolaceae bacterium]|nr:hypothetical protein [Balneolaceae bacterium]